MADDWKSVPMRQRMVHQIDELLRQAPNGAQRSATDLESSLFIKANNKKEEYQNYMNKLINFLKESAQSQNVTVNNASNLTAMLSNTQNSNVATSQMVGQVITSGGHVTLCSNPTGGPMLHASNTSQPQIIHQQTAGCTQQITHGNTTGGQITHAGVATNQPNVANMAGNSFIAGTQRAPNPQAMSQPGMVSGMGNQNEIMWQGHQKVRRQNDNMIMINVTPKHPGMNTVAVNQQINKLGTLPMTINQNDQVNQMNVAGQIRAGVTMQPRVPSPSFAGNVNQIRQSLPSTSVPGALQSQVPHSSVTFITPSPSSNATPSPLGSRMNQIGAPSPNGMLNTPGQPTSQLSSPISSGSSEAYMEKVKQLRQKYLGSLKNIVQKHGNNDADKSSRKIKNFLDVLENPHKQGSTYDNLIRIETLLERIYDDPRKVFFDGIQLALESPRGAHTIHRTLSPALKTLLGPDLEPSLPKKRKSETAELSSDGHVISDIIQGEVARLPPRFKVNLDGHQISGSDDLTLVCQLDDGNLPCVPPITLLVPPSYPNAPPQCKLSEVDYDTTEFLKKVREIMSNRQLHLPEVCTLTMILDTWEMSVRQACSGKPFIPDSINPLINLNILC